MVDESKHLTRLLDNLLAYARITDTTQAYSFRSIGADEIIEQALRTARSRLDSAGFTVDVDIAPDLPPLRADWTSICLAFDNLVDNAIRYSKDNRHLHIEAACAGSMVQIRVSDRGVGIPADEVGHVTRRFFRGRTTVAAGSGLGLAIVERIVADHGGTLSIDSVVGSGTTVTIKVPSSRSAV
jgi:signal transduction histidine kinase